MILNQSQMQSKEPNQNSTLNTALDTAQHKTITTIMKQLLELFRESLHLLSILFQIIRQQKWVAIVKTTIVIQSQVRRLLLIIVSLFSIPAITTIITIILIVNAMITATILISINVKITTTITVVVYLNSRFK